jgi:DNA-binding NtrC family response regulator
MRTVFQTIQRVAPTDASVYIHGESGTGKELVARAIHERSKRASGPFVKVNCGALAETLLESELFGHEKGAFTGALKRKLGRFELADRGTLFLDEIGDVSPAVQVKLLRVLQERQFERVGGEDTVTVDVRVVSATHRDMKGDVAAGKFREDLFYRLSVIRIHVPPLRDRREEIPHLSTFFLREASERLGKPGVRLSAETLDLFDGFSWPGNVRQLRNEVQRAVAMALPGGLIGPELLSPIFATASEKPAEKLLRSPALGRRTNLAAAVESLEREMIEGALAKADGNISETARLLGLTRRGLYLKMQRLGVSAARV